MKKSNLKFKLQKSIDIIFVIFFLLILFSFTIGIIIRGQHDISIAENRSLSKFQGFSFAGFFNRSFQDNIEDTLSDQMVGGQTIKGTLNAKNAQVSSYFQKQAMNLVAKDYKEYIPISNDVYYYGDSNYMIAKPIVLDENKEQLTEIGNQYTNHFKDVDSYLYLVSNSPMIDLNSIESSEKEIASFVKESFSPFKFDYLKVTNFSQYKEYFYETDHHWNYKGSYQGYKDILKLLNVSDDPIVPTGTKTYPIDFYGSYARKASIFDNHEQFTVYKFDIPEHKEYVNKEEKVYGNKDGYDNGEYNTDKSTNHYGDFYGMDFALVEYDFNNPDKENLLIIGNSYSNSINALVASHFNKTYVVDVRHYNSTFNEDFNAEQFVKDNDIDKFIFIISPDYLINGNFLLDHSKEG